MVDVHIVASGGGDAWKDAEAKGCVQHFSLFFVVVFVVVVNAAPYELFPTSQLSSLLCLSHSFFSFFVDGEKSIMDTFR